MKKNSKYMMDIVPGVVIAVFSLLYLSQVPGIQAFEGLGSTPLDNHFVPYLWGGVLLFLGLWLVGRGIVKFKRFKAAGGEAKKNSLGAAIAEKREVIASFVALVIYVGLMDLVGFVIMTVLYTFAQILILTPGRSGRKTLSPPGSWLWWPASCCTIFSRFSSMCCFPPEFCPCSVCK